MRSGAGESGIDIFEERFARFTAEIKGAGFHQMLEHALVDRAPVDALREIREVRVRSVFLPLRDDLLGGQFADALDARESKANRSR